MGSTGGGGTASIHEVLDQIRAAATGEKDKGDRFERLMRAYLKTDVVWAERFSDVWLWSEWPDRDGPDTGIDLVAVERETGDVCAIQCKFYDANHTLEKADIDSFFTASGKAPFGRRLIISTTDKWTSHAEAALHGQQIPVSRLRVADLDASSIDWSHFTPTTPDSLMRRAAKSIRPHQAEAMRAVLDGFATEERGKLIMACGTGKTYTALKITEALVPTGGYVLVLVPSISLLSQTLTEWGQSASIPLRPFAVCSDAKVGKRASANDTEDISIVDLPFPASTDARKLAQRATATGGLDDGNAITVVYATYQSIDVIHDAQQLGLPAFDLIICDEAHRTTGVTLAGSHDSHFVKVHDNDFIAADKRLYMTATPRLYDDSSKATAAQNDAAICSMDDETLYGPEFHRLGFGKAVGEGLLSDYKVLILTVDEDHIAATFQAQLADDNNELNLDDAVKIVGCWNGLAKRGTGGFQPGDAPMQRAVAFSRSIADSKALTTKFQEVLGTYDDAHGTTLAVDVHHVDGTYNALRRNAELDWLKAPTPKGECRILSNARCLSEGIDVPALDAVLFLNPRNSVVDVVQSVGRVMRKAPGKDYGYIILPVGIPAGMEPSKALNDNKRYRVVWQVLQALRAHDDRFNATVNKIDLNKSAPANIMIQPVGPDTDDQASGDANSLAQQTALFRFDEWKDAIYAKIVTKVGQRAYYEQWADTVAAIAERHVHRITEAVSDPTSAKGQAFEEFLAELRANINPGLGRSEAIDMLAQHLITRPVFDALFGGETFTEHNPVSIAMTAMLATLDDPTLDSEHETLADFYAAVRRDAEGIDNHEGRQRIITRLYERFFKTALPKTADAFGIVYTPLEVVDFMLRSTDVALRQHFHASLSTEGVQVLDPFTGTGTFIVRLLQSGLIRPEDLYRKYTSELNANEILLLAYYIAGVNIESTYHNLQEVLGDSAAAYEPFDGLVLTDTFQLAEAKPKLAPDILEENNRRLTRQRQLDIKVIIGNPPYSVGQTSQNDSNQNADYPQLDERIRQTYAARSQAGLKRNLYDSYVRAIRWASDRIGDEGIICYVTNGAWIDTGSADGLRKALTDEFTAIYVFNLRGNQRTSGETSRREGGKIFGSGSRTPVAITLLIKTKQHTGAAQIRYHDIGDYLTREEKLDIISGARDIQGIEWSTIAPDANGDWINPQDPTFDIYQILGDKKNPANTPLFETYSLGVVTNRDAWAYNFDREALAANMQSMIDFYNEQRESFAKRPRDTRHFAIRHRKKVTATPAEVEEFINQDSRAISWTVNLKNDLRKNKVATFDASKIVPSMYRPYCKQWLYFDRQLNERVLLQPRLFPTPQQLNRVIVVSGVGSSRAFSALVSGVLPNLDLVEKGQAFPLYIYEMIEGDPDLFAAPQIEGDYIRRDGISQSTQERYKARYGPQTSAEDIFYYVYGLLHSPEYRTRYATNLAKSMPRIPMVKAFHDYSTAGRALAELHLNYETIEPWPLQGLPPLDVDPQALRVTKESMRFGKQGKNDDRSRIIINDNITLSEIPNEAYDYTVNGKSALEWIMDRYRVTTDNASGIVNNPNRWSDDPRHIVDLVARITRVSIESAQIIRNLPRLELE